MDEERETARREEFYSRIHPFLTNAFKLIVRMVALCSDTDGSRHLVDEILHSICFFGQMGGPSGQLKFTPEEIVSDPEMFEELMRTYSRPLRYFDTQSPEPTPLPRRNPFSCVLDMVVLETRQRNRGQNEDEIKTQIRASLAKLVNSLKKKFLVPAVICVSQYNSVNYYGVSVSTSSYSGRVIAIGASCLSGYWNQNVADAVMTYYPEKVPKSYFNGTFTLPGAVSCQAYNITDITEEGLMEPCTSCRNLFGLNAQADEQGRGNMYGNCAEVECLSNMLNNNEDLLDENTPRHVMYTAHNREMARAAVEEELRRNLKEVNFETWDSQFYTPQIERP